MQHALSRLLMSLVLLLFLVLPAIAENGLAIDPKACLECHEDVVSVEEFSASVHGQNACTSCHVELSDLQGHMDGMVMPKPVSCVRCHKPQTAEHYASVHMINDVSCADCHSDIHTLTAWKGDDKKVVEKCISCHDDHTDYLDSVHGQGVMAGNTDSAACHDCHNLHEIKPLGDPNSRENREFHTSVCLKCHANEEMMERNGVFNVAVETYMESYHGKNYRLGFPELVAGCADCHTSHNVLPASDPKSSVNEANLVDVCAKCHANATPLFTMYYAHGSHDKDKYPILYYTFLAMTGLLVSTFGVFWIHSLLWMFRGFVETREKKRELMEHGLTHHIDEPYKMYRRFTKRHVFLHFLVIVSFLGLSLTGLPLKFADQPWAKSFMDFFGSAANAALIHRFCAGITFIYFGLAIYMSIHYLFIRQDIRGNVLQRLFGPESLCPNFRDIRDVTNMVRWFLFRGPKPTFDRWTYWEKFDFIAVFWGMFAIGGSGLMLWFPEFFGFFLPGWAFSVATIVHSDEALLATGFIFTVHFFNTHGRPEKFPMDFVIFNGEMPKEEFIHERGDQWKRYQAEGILHKYEKTKPSGILYDFFFKAFGFTAVFIGISLVVLMVYAFMHGSH